MMRCFFFNPRMLSTYNTMSRYDGSLTHEQTDNIQTKFVEQKYLTSQNFQVMQRMSNFVFAKGYISNIHGSKQTNQQKNSQWSECSTVLCVEIFNSTSCFCDTVPVRRVTTVDNFRRLLKRIRIP